MPSINVVPLRKAAPKRTHLTQERTEPFLDNSAAGFITVGNMTSCPGSSCPVPCLPVPGRSLRAGRTCLENKMEGALGERKPCTEYHPVRDCMWVSARNRCGNGRRRSWDCTHTPRYTCLQSILPPLVPPSLSQFCQPAALQQTHLSTSVIAHTTIATLQHRGTEYIRVPCTSLTHTRTRATLCIVRQAVSFQHNGCMAQRLQDGDAHTGPAYLSDLKLKVHSNRYRDDLQ